MKKRIHSLLGGFLLFLGITLIVLQFCNDYFNNVKEENAIQQFYEITKEDSQNTNFAHDLSEEINSEIKDLNQYVAIVKIPKINLIKGLYSKDNVLNNVDTNIAILPESDMPDQEHGSIILASHSGNSRIAYFKNLYKLTKNDQVMIDYENKTYIYSVTKMYEIEKSGQAFIDRNNNKTSLILITCKHNTDKQIVIICELIERKDAYV